MSDTIFRKKSLDRVNSPEDLHEYVRVTSPAVWLLMASVIVLLIGACVWGTFGLIETTIHTTAYVQDKVVYAYVSDEEIDSIKPGMVINVGDAECVITAIAESAKPLQQYLDEFYGEGYVWENQVKDPDAMVWRLTGDTNLDNGMYAAQLVVEQIHPISFLFN